MKSIKDFGYEINNAVIAYNIVPTSFIVSLVSQFDAYVGGLLRAMFNIKPEILNSSEKNWSFSQIIKYNSIDEFKEFIIEKEIESVLRKSHSDQFEWLENKLGISLRKGLDSWSSFIEITERRNLFVHCNGIISTQYINKCNENGVKFKEPIKLGNNLVVTEEYFREAYECLFEIGVKLTHVIWRKLLPNNREEADGNFSDICYNLISKENYNLAINLLEFSTHTFKNYSSENIKLILIINLSLAYKLNGENEKSKEILTKNDFSACSDKFKLAYSILTDDYQNSLTLMKKISDNGEVSTFAYAEWPLFKEFRKTDAFISTYKEIFNEDFNCNITDEIKQIENTFTEAASIKENIQS